ncbi:MAG: phosphotransferase [Gemmatimonadota bacterium]
MIDRVRRCVEARSADLLAARYRAPRMVGWIDRCEPWAGGPVFEWIEGVTPACLDCLPVSAVGALLRELHSDSRLGASLARLGDRVTTCAEAYRRSYHERFTEDLAFIAAAPPPFVGRDTLDWMRAEAGALESRVLASAAFAEPADSPVHGDMWLDNLLVSGDRWYVLDWDGLGLGDRVVDWAMLFGPTQDRVRVDERQARSAAALGAAERERLGAYARASLLDWIIDPLADWVQAGSEPLHGEAVRARNGRVHREALAFYRERYGGGWAGVDEVARPPGLAQLYPRRDPCSPC